MQFYDTSFTNKHGNYAASVSFTRDEFLKLAKFVGINDNGIEQMQKNFAKHPLPVPEEKKEEVTLVKSVRSFFGR